MSDFRIAAFASSLFLAVVATSIGCGGGEGTVASGSSAKAEAKGDAKATYQYWEAIQKPLPESNYRKILSLVSPVNPDPSSQGYIVSVVRRVSEDERKRCDQLAALPVLGVDPDAGSYSVALMQVRQEKVSLQESIAQALETGFGLPGGDEAAFDFLVSMFRHSNDGEDALWNVLKEQAAEKATAVAEAKSNAKALNKQIAGLYSGAKSLQASELDVRLKLSQRYGREFPAGPASSSEPVKVPAGAGAAPRTEAEIRKDLVRRRVRGTGSGWSFDSLSEFRTLVITGSLSLGGHAIVEVETTVVGNISGAQHTFRLRLVYQKDPDGWKLVIVEQV